MAGLGTQSAIERADLVTPRLTVRAPRFYPNQLLVRIWRGPGVGDCPGLLDSRVSAQRPSRGVMSVRQAKLGQGGSGVEDSAETLQRDLAGRVLSSEGWPPAGSESCAAPGDRRREA